MIYHTVPVLTSVISYDLKEREQPFLSYTWDRSEGPALRRTGTEAPSMQIIDEDPDLRTADPVGLRQGTWLVRNDSRGKDLAEVTKALEDASRDSDDHRLLTQMREKIETIESHEQVFDSRMGRGYRVVGMQGCGDLTMNEWKVAYVHGPLSATQAPAIVALQQEPVEDRRYTCLVKWKSEGGSKRPRVSIEEVKFSRNTSKPQNMVWVRFGDQWLPRASHIEFAVSNQQVIRNGVILSAVASCHQFGDLRHLLALPNLNPKEPLFPGDGPNYRPRNYFGAPQTADVWLGEEYLIRGGNNLRRAALLAPVAITYPVDCLREQLRGALQRIGYHEVASETAPLMRGEWRSTHLLLPDRNAIEIYLRRNTYAWSMIGLTRDNDRLLSLACQAKPGETGYQLEDAAQILLECGAWNALLIDEGADVFQLAKIEGKLRELVNLSRSRLRAVFFFATPRKGAKV